MTDREKLIELLKAGHEAFYKSFEPFADYFGALADHLLDNGVTFAADTNVSCKWINVADEKPMEFVSVLGHMTDAGDFPAVRECYLVGNAFYFLALRDIHPVDKWAYMPEPTKED